jgi:hypothetical protein
VLARSPPRAQDRQMPNVSLHTVLRVSNDVVFRELDGEAVILNLVTGIYFGLDHVGTRMWQLVEQHGQLDVVLERLRDEFDAPAQTLEEDLVRLTSQLIDKGLLVANDAATASS